jgi:hypothetical protein
VTQTVGGAANSRLQTPNSREAPNSKLQILPSKRRLSDFKFEIWKLLGIWILGFESSLELGVWDLDFS